MKETTKPEFTLIDKIKGLRVDGLSLGAKLIFLELVALAQREGEAFPSNAWLSIRFGISRTQASNYVSGLERLGLIRSDIDHDHGNRRRIFIRFSRIEALAGKPPKKKRRDFFNASYKEFFQHLPKKWRLSRELDAALKGYEELRLEKDEPLKVVQVKKYAGHLVKLSDGDDLDKAIKIVIQSIAKGWRGFRPLEAYE